MRSRPEKDILLRNGIGLGLGLGLKRSASLALLVLAACGRQGDLLPPPDARPADARVDRYFEDGFDGPVMAPGDTEHDEGFTGVEEHRHRGRPGGGAQDDPSAQDGGNASGGGGGSA